MRGGRWGGGGVGLSRSLVLCSFNGVLQGTTRGGGGGRGYIGG